MDLSSATGHMRTKGRWKQIFYALQGKGKAHISADPKRRQCRQYSKDANGISKTERQTNAEHGSSPWANQSKIWDDPNANWVKFFNMLPEFQRIQTETWAWLRQLNTESNPLQQVNAEFIWYHTEAAHAHGNLRNTTFTRCWRWMLLIRPKQIGWHPSCSHQRKTEHSDLAWTTASWTK